MASACRQLRIPWDLSRNCFHTLCSGNIVNTGSLNPILWGGCYGSTWVGTHVGHDLIHHFVRVGAGPLVPPAAPLPAPQPASTSFTFTCTTCLLVYTFIRDMRLPLVLPLWLLFLLRARRRHLCNHCRLLLLLPGWLQCSPACLTWRPSFTLVSLVMVLIFTYLPKYLSTITCTTLFTRASCLQPLPCTTCGELLLLNFPNMQLMVAVPFPTLWPLFCTPLPTPLPAPAKAPTPHLMGSFSPPPGSGGLFTGCWTLNYDNGVVPLLGLGKLATFGIATWCSGGG